MYVGKELVSIYDPARAYNGYTLWGPYHSQDVYLVDMKGRFVHHWRTPYLLGLHGRLLPNGNLLVGQRIPTGPAFHLPGSGGQLLEMEWDGNIVWKYEDLYMNAHDFDRMKNGNTMVCHWMQVPRDIAAKVKGGIPESEEEVIWGDCFQEITSEGKVVWEWLVHEHLDFETDIICPLCPRDCLIYTNSIFVMPDDNILTHFRLTNTVAVIDRKSGDITWRWQTEELGHAHNPVLLDNGNILIFDNGLHRLLSGIGFPYSRVLEVDMKTKEIKWEYKDDNPFSFFSSIWGNAQRLPNGNTLICDATKGRIFEVTPQKEIVWEFTNPFYHPWMRGPFGPMNGVFRAYRYGPDYGGLKGKDLDPDRFELVLKEKGKLIAEEGKTPEAEEEIKSRLSRLGY